MWDAFGRSRTRARALLLHLLLLLLVLLLVLLLLGEALFVGILDLVALDARIAVGVLVDSVLDNLSTAPLSVINPFLTSTWGWVLT